jgi:hypothetical protein
LSWDGLGLVCNLTTALDLEDGVGVGSGKPEKPKTLSEGR